MSSAELTRWMAYEQVTGPLGPERIDALVAIAVHQITSALGAKPPKPSKLMPRWDRAPRRQSWQQILAVLRPLATGSQEADDDGTA